MKLQLSFAHTKSAKDFSIRPTLGTAMGTPPAPMYATLYFAIKELTLLEEFGTNISFYRRYIDDVFGVWIPSDDPTSLHFESLEASMSFGRLTWIVNPLSTSVVFLDLTLTITATGTIDTRLYEKALNLYLYLPPHSQTKAFTCRCRKKSFIVCSLEVILQIS